MALAIAFSLRTAGAGVWTNLGTFSTDVVTTIAVDPSNPSVIYAGTSVNGVYKTVDGGVNWSNDTVGLTSSYMLSVVIDPMTPSTVYAGTFSGGVFKTTDSGLNWSPANTGLTDTTGIQLVIDPSTPSTLYVATFAGVFKSIDGAANWSPASTGLTSLTTLQALAIDPVTPSNLYVASYGDGVFKTIDGAGTWAASNSGLPSLFAQDLAIDPMTPTTLFVGLATTPSVHKSVDGGATWADSSFGLTSVSFSLLVDPVVPGRVWAGMGSGLHRSNDGGAVFGPGATGFADPSNTVQALFATAAGITYAGTSACCGHGPVYRYDASCGDGFVDAGEECDDADLDAGDGCNAACEIEACNVCVGNAPSVCTPDDDLTCDDGDPCTTPDECSAGACVSTPIACPACEACTAGSCVPTMRTACAQPIQPAKSRLIIKDQDTDARDLVVWKWTNGEEVQFEDLGDPTSTTDYTLCVFDGGGGIALRSVIPAAGTCSGAPCWKPLGTNGWGYTDSAGSAGGFIRLRVKAGDHGRAKAVVKGKGEPLETPNLSAMTLPVTVQLQGEEPAACVEATFSSTGVLQSDSSKFIGRSD